MNKKSQKELQTAEDVRVDKWLWAARFYKTRRLATDAIQGGKVQLNGSKGKPSKTIKINDEISINQGGIIRTFIITAVSEKRGPASVAQLMYEETEESIKRLVSYKENMKNASNYIQTDGKPNKKDRRLIHRFKQNNQ